VVEDSNPNPTKNPNAGRFEFICQKCGDIGKTSKYNKGQKYHKECWLSISGGLKEGTSRGKSGWYKGYWCDSSYELAFNLLL
jgi:hypothetical protein